MPQYRRSHFQSGTYFFTVVSFIRLPIFPDETSRKILHTAWPWSSFHRYARLGYFESDWGERIEKGLMQQAIGE
ncbi:MAG TPA: hypothetical protein VKF38_12660 [Anaerolineaceae bacterium]|nr:hypothetical protein [Anaerolineaceae bacterium]